MIVFLSLHSMNNMIIDEFYKKIGLKIRSARVSANNKLSQKELGRLLGMSRTSVVNIEQGKHHIQIHILYKVAQILNCDVKELLPENSIDLFNDELTSNIDLKPKERKSVKNFIDALEKKDK